jgi:hypothetical protein
MIDSKSICRANSLVSESTLLAYSTSSWAILEQDYIMAVYHFCFERRKVIGIVVK